MFETEFKYFVDHQDELVDRFAGKVLVIRGDQVVGAYSSAIEAYVAASDQYETGTFMLQPCEPGPQAYTITIATVGTAEVAA